MPTDGYALEIDATTTVTRQFHPEFEAGSWSSVPENVSREIPPLTDAGQAYYWTHSWQAGERETLDSLAAGQGHIFETADDAIRYLLDPEA